RNRHEPCPAPRRPRPVPDHPGRAGYRAPAGAGGTATGRWRGLAAIPQQGGRAGTEARAGRRPPDPVRTRRGTAAGQRRRRACGRGRRGRRPSGRGRRRPGRGPRPARTGCHPRCLRRRQPAAGPRRGRRRRQLRGLRRVLPHHHQGRDPPRHPGPAAAGGGAGRAAGGDRRHHPGQRPRPGRGRRRPAGGDRRGVRRARSAGCRGGLPPLLRACRRLTARAGRARVAGPTMCAFAALEPPPMNHDRSHALFSRAQQLLPGGVNSPVRAFKSVGGEPCFVQRADGPYLFDVDGNRYIAYVGSWGPMIVGHNHPAVREAVQQAIADGLSYGAPCAAEVTMAETITRLVPSCEMVRMVNSGTEATLSAIRLARGATGRQRIVKFEGCYHGHGDSFLVKAGSGMLTLGVPTSPGVPAGLSELTATLSYNDFEGATRLFDEIGSEIAAVIIEPVVGNANCIPPREGYLRHLRELCTRHGALLIFDEVMTGFRVALGGAQAHYGITPDLTTFGKIIGGGMPVGAYGGRR